MSDDWAREIDRLRDRTHDLANRLLVVEYSLATLSTWQTRADETLQALDEAARIVKHDAEQRNTTRELRLTGAQKALAVVLALLTIASLVRGFF